MSSAPSARFTHQGKCQRNCFDLPAASCGFTGDQTDLCWITGGMRKTLFWGNCPDPVWHFSLKVLRRTCWHLCACTGADAAGQHPGSAAAGHSSHLTALRRPGCPWWHPQGRLFRSGKLIWHWKIERWLWNCGKNQDDPNAVAAALSILLGITFPLVTPVTPIWGQHRKSRCKVKNRCQSEACPNRF